MAAHWNQTEEDWRTMLALGQGWGLRQRDEAGVDRLVASTLVLQYGAFAWVSMVLVLPAWRDQGHASRLLRVALDELAARQVLPVLDATPAGHAVYLEQGFVDCWGFARWRCKVEELTTRLQSYSLSRKAGEGRGEGGAVEDPHPYPLPQAGEGAIRVRALRDGDWPAIEYFDLPTFGASRLPLLRRLARRLPQAAWVVEGDGKLRGYLLGREGRTALQLGPLVADSDEVARALLSTALAAVAGAAASADLDLIVDLREGQAAVGAWLQERGFAVERLFTRMVHAAEAAAPGDPRRVVLVAGPELG